MGTSQSYRSPNTARWAGFVAAVTGGAEPDRVRSELFNAGNEWEEALSGAAIQSYASSMAVLHGEMGDRLARGERPELVVGEVVAEARRASGDAGFSPAAPIADRAFTRLILSTLGGVTDLAGSELGPAERWEAARGSEPSALVSRFVGEVLGQFARHVADREAGRDGPARRGASSTAAMADQLASGAASVGEAAARTAADGTSLDGWSSLIAQAFETGRRLPRGGR